MAIELKLSRTNRIYHPSEVIDGTVVITTSTSISHQGIRVNINGCVSLQLSSGTIGVIESLYSSIKPVSIINTTVDIKPPGKLNPGKTEIPFSVPLEVPMGGDPDRFYETYHGSNISIQYLITADVVRGYLHKALSTTFEFIIESGKGKRYKAPVPPESVNFYITQDTQSHQLLPSLQLGGFRVTGRVAMQCSLTDPIIGEVTVEKSDVPIHSIDIHLLRIESIVVGERTAVQTTGFQTIQVADGDVCRGMSLPIYIILARLLTCPSLSAGSFSIEFQLQVIVSFASELSKLYSQPEWTTSKPWVAFQTIPLRLVRAERENDE